jgi:hypothetical protein
VVTSHDTTPIDAQQDVVPLFAIDSKTVHDFLGTGFLIGGVMVTAWHCVADATRQGLTVVAAQWGGGGYAPRMLRHLEQDANSSDLAVAEVEALPSIGFELTPESLKLGTDVWTYGYPLTQPPNERQGTWMLEGRFLQGYVTRHFYYSDRRVRCYELDMRAPAGLSGAPIVEIPSRRVAGVVIGVNDVARIEEFRKVDVETGSVEPELQRIDSFALALDTETLSNLTGTATGGLPLSQHLEAHNARADDQLRRLYGPSE